MDARIVNIVNNYMILFIQQVLRINQQKQLNNINNIIGNSNIYIRTDQITYKKNYNKKIFRHKCQSIDVLSFGY